MTVRYFVSVKRFKTNVLYAHIATDQFIKSTTGSQLKLALKLQAFWDKVFRINVVSSFLGTRLVQQQRQDLVLGEPQQAKRITLKGCVVSAQASLTAPSANLTNVQSSFTVQSGSLANAAMTIGLEITNWDKDNFICAPGTSYNAGRFKRYKTMYPPFLPAHMWRKDLPIITTEIPGLEIDRVRSQMDIRIGEICAPMMGVWLKERSTCIWLTTTQHSAMGNNGFSVKEDNSTGTLTIEVMSPIVRDSKTPHASSKLPSWDRGARISKNDQAQLGFSVQQFPCHNFDDFYAAFRQIIKRQNPQPVLCKKTLPLSSAWGLIEQLYNSKRWSETHSYYHAGFIPPFIDADAWSAGWTGGLALSYALLNRGNALSQGRALRNLAFFFSEGGQSDAGIFYATGDGTNWGGDDYFFHEGIGTTNWIHIRRCGDYLCLVIKHFRLLEARGQGHLIAPGWKERTLKCADAMCKIWNTNKHFGQFINPQTLEIRIGNSDAGAILPAALAECAAYFDRPDYLDIAQQALAFYYNDFQQKGFTAGGPLEILCAPDSESALHLLESLVTVYERTRDASLLDKALRYCNYLSTWFYSYDVDFPAGTFYHNTGVQTTGSMLASSQNRCAVPNMCTLSGDAFWRLYRYTGDTSIMQLALETVHNTHQYLSRPDSPILTVKGVALPDGSIHECIQTGDWVGPTGQIPYEYPTSWAEVAHLLSICELPGIYLQLDDCQLTVVDHLDVSIASQCSATITLTISNPTAHHATTTLYAETKLQAAQLLGIDLKQHSHSIDIPAASSVLCHVDVANATVQVAVVNSTVAS